MRHWLPTDTQFAIVDQEQSSFDCLIVAEPLEHFVSDRVVIGQNMGNHHSASRRILLLWAATDQRP